MSLVVEQSGGLARVTIARPQKRNALDLELGRELAATWERLAADDAVRVIVLTGAGERAFCAGADLETVMPLILAGGFQEAVGPEGNVFMKSVPMYKPVIAAINGDAVAGGTELLQATDIRVAVEDARFGVQEVRWGLFPSGGSTVRLARQVPWCHAMEILLTGRLLSAQEALAIGLVNRVVPRAQLEETVEQYVQLLLRNGSLAMERVKRSVLEAQEVGPREGFRIESAHGQAVFASDDAREGPRAFLARRDPVFRRR